jgi:hypothetical protein
VTPRPAREYPQAADAPAPIGKPSFHPYPPEIFHRQIQRRAAQHRKAVNQQRLTAFSFVIDRNQLF